MGGVAGLIRAKVLLPIAPKPSPATVHEHNRTTRYLSLLFFPSLDIRRLQTIVGIRLDFAPYVDDHGGSNGPPQRDLVRRPLSLSKVKRGVHVGSDMLRRAVII